jgi:hypothetical protein
MQDTSLSISSHSADNKFISCRKIKFKFFVLIVKWEHIAMTTTYLKVSVSLLTRLQPSFDLIFDSVFCKVASYSRNMPLMREFYTEIKLDVLNYEKC